jgi:uncharacterized surface protein with fasciclin (FAS1) repeats
MLRRNLTIATSALALAAVLTACSSSGGSSKSSEPAASSVAVSSAPASSAAVSSAPVSSAPVSASSSAAAASTVFGPQCTALGLTAAALAPAAAVPVGTVAANVPFLSNVVAAANAAGLTATLNAAPDITVFAPVDDAFKKEPKKQLHALLTDPKMKPTLVATLTYAVVTGRLAKADLPGAHKTLQGGSIKITGSGDSYTVNGKAHILCGGIQTKNAVVYLIDTVLHPAG